MKHTTKRLLAALLAGLMLLPMAACGQTAEDPDETKKASETLTEDETGDPNYICDLPNDLDFEDTEVVFLYVNHDGREDELYSEKLGQGTILDSVYERNLAVENQLGVKFGFQDVPDDGTALSKVGTMVSAGDTSVDIFSYGSFMAVPSCLSGYFLDLNHLYYVDTSKHYWSQDYNDVATFSEDNLQFLATSSAAISVFRLSFMTIFNRSLLEEWKLPNIYDLVDNGEWTLEKQYEITKDIYVDLDGSGSRGEKDLFGHLTGNNKNMDCYPAASNIKLIVRDESGEWIFNKDELENLITMAERVNTLIRSPGTFAHSMGDDIGSYYTIQKFATETAVTATTQFLSVEKYIGDLADVAYGIAPIPKLSVEQEKYHTYVNDQVTGFGVSSAIGDEERQDVLGAVMEAVAYHSYKIVRPAYYNSSLSLRFMQDERSSDILDLMFETLAFDYGYYHVGGMGGIKGDLRSVLPGSNPAVASRFKLWERKLSSELKGENEAIARLQEQWSEK